MFQKLTKSQIHLNISCDSVFITQSFVISILPRC